MSVSNNQHGFTIIELLIATMVFSVVLLLAATGLIKIGKAYTKGVISTRTQEASRNVINTVAQSLQLNPGSFSGLRGPGAGNDTAAYCIGNQQFSFITNKQLLTSPSGTDTFHALVAHATDGSCPAGTVADPVESINVADFQGQELLGPRMQLANFAITDKGSGRFEISVRVLYGEDDLFNNPNTTSASCKPQTGVEYCAVSELSTIVQRRVE